MRLGALAAGAVLACAGLVAAHWIAAEFAALRAEQIPAHSATGLDAGELEARARAELERALERRDGHPTYLDRLGRLELRAGARLRAAGEMGEAWPLLERSEALALEAFEAQPFPHHLLRAAAARAERSLIDAPFERFLHDAYALGPQDQYVRNGILLLSLYNWMLLDRDQQQRAADLLLESRGTASGAGAAIGVVSRRRAWPLLCADDRVRSAFEEQCRRLAPTG